MNRLLFLISFFPFFLFSQNCFTDTNVSNADSVKYCFSETTCYDVCDGLISITVYGNNQPYSYEWFNSSNPWPGVSYQDTLCPGDYIVTITDVNGDLVDNSNVISINGPPNFSVFEESVSDPSCFNFNDGYIDITVAGATPFDPDGIPNSGDEYYSFLWENGVNTEDRFILDSGIYVVNILDQNNCLRVDSFFLNNPLQVDAVISGYPISCIGQCDGVVFVDSLVGQPPFSFIWDDPLSQTSDTAFNICYGLSTIVITDSNGCSNTKSYFIQNPDSLKISSIMIDTSCYSSCDGEIIANIQGGNAPYGMIWKQNGSIVDSLNNFIVNLCPDLYTLVFSDANNCQDSIDLILPEKDSFDYIYSITNDSCYSSCKGQILVQFINAKFPVIYSWSNGLADSLVSNLCSDSLSLEIIDGDGCRDTFYFYVDEPLELNFDSIFTIDNACFGESNGSIYVNSSGGTGIITSQWVSSNNYLSNSTNISNLSAGNYSLQISDLNSCVKDTIISIYHPDSLFGIPLVEDASCFMYADASININTQGGVDPVNIYWTNSISNSLVLDSLLSGEYIYVLTDSNGCFFTDTVHVDQPEQMLVDDSLVSVQCNGEKTGSIYLNVIGGIMPYSFLWSDSSTNQDLINLSSGFYNVEVKDGNNCSVFKSYFISEPTFPLIINEVINDVLCAGSNTGSVDLTVSGGTIPYTYLWSNASVSEDIDSLFAGNYSVIVVDSNGCDTNINIQILENLQIVDNAHLQNVLCYSESNGVIDLSAAYGGVPPYYFSINGGSFLSNSIFSNLTFGQYVVDIMDINSCINTFYYFIDQPQSITSNYYVDNIDCFGNSNGNIDLIVSGGVGDYSYLWSNNETDAGINNLSSGFYSVIVSDSNNCNYYDTIIIVEPSAIDLLSSQSDILCSGDSDGFIDVEVSGGTGSLMYSWNDGSALQDRYNLIAGNYVLTVSDINGCSLTEVFNIIEPLPYFPVSQVNDVNCFGQFDGEINFSISGNTPPYYFQWNNGQNSSDIDNLSSGTYTVSVTDENGCFDSFDVFVDQPSELMIDYTIIDASCEENNDGSILLNVYGGTFPYAFYWSNGLIDKDLFNLSKGNYSVQISDANSCNYLFEMLEVGFEGLDGCIEIPSGFTPNGDGIHDEWSIYGLFNFPNVLVSVYNRWGQQVFYSDGYNIPWDGKSNGIDLPIATYFYIIELVELDRVYDGTVTIKR